MQENSIEEKIKNGLWTYTIEDKKIVLDYLGKKDDTITGYDLEINFK